MSASTSSAASIDPAWRAPGLSEEEHSPCRWACAAAAHCDPRYTSSGGRMQENDHPCPSRPIVHCPRCRDDHAMTPTHEELAFFRTFGYLALPRLFAADVG